MSPAFLSPEITADVDLCTPGGRLNPAAIAGWSRRPHHRPNLRRWPHQALGVLGRGHP